MMFETLSSPFLTSASLGTGFICFLAAISLALRSRRLHAEIGYLRQAAAPGRDPADGVSEARSRFIATLSHEIRTPLHGILGMAELLLETGIDAEQTAYVEAIRTSGTALVSLVDEILDFSKIEAGKLDLVEAPFDLPSLVEGVAELLAPRAQGKGLEIACFIASDVPSRVMGDAGRLRQILFNLAGNAVKFTGQGGIGIRVSHAGGSNIRFAVTDTGAGISKDLETRIFDDFEQGGGPVRQHEGTGLGLAISRRIATRMGGKIELENSSLAGSTFVITVPLPSELAPDFGPGASACRQLPGRRALIVAASPFEAPYLAERLAEAGITVQRAGSEAAATPFLVPMQPDFGPPDIVIVDCALGLEASRRLGEAARAAGTPLSLILFSPFERRAFGQATTQGFDGWLVKPVRTRSLFARLGADSLEPMRSFDRQKPSLEPAPGYEILLAEDNDINALLATRHLERLGGRVTRCRDGLAAVSIAEAAIARRRPAFDIIFIDIRMPGRSGFETAKLIRKIEGEAGQGRTKIIALTADLVETSDKNAAEAGFDEVLTKPVDFRRISRILEGIAAVPTPKAALAVTE